MMHIGIYCIGENKFSYLQEGESDYLSRLSRYCKINLVSVPGTKMVSSISPSIIQKKDWEILKNAMPSRKWCVVLDVKGNGYSSEEFAEMLQRWQTQGISTVFFAIGGAFGLGKIALKEADFVLSLSKMTFPHELVRLILLEQLYRAFTILRGEKYHK